MSWWKKWLVQAFINWLQGLMAEPNPLPAPTPNVQKEKSDENEKEVLADDTLVLNRDLERVRQRAIARRGPATS